MMDETTANGEPTEWQMEFAVNHQLQAKNKKMQNMADVEAENGMSALVKLIGMDVSGTEFKITSFDKYELMTNQAIVVITLLILKLAVV